MKTVIVTGSHGYIGSHVIKKIAEAGYVVDGMDYRLTVNDIKKYVRKDRILDITKNNLWAHNWGKYDVVIHLAGSISVEQSVKQPWLYFKNNIIGTNNVIEGFEAENIIFSSTATAFSPTTPYALSKVAGEQLIRACKMPYTIFRFFNVAGSNGEYSMTGPSTHLIRCAAEAAAFNRPFLDINGTDWDTEDGTCVRDYVHVEDVAEGILKAIEMPSASSKDFDCLASGNGYSVRQVIDTMKNVTGVNFKVIEKSRRDGDVASLLMPRNIQPYIDCNRTLEDMCLSAYKMELK